VLLESTLIGALIGFLSFASTSCHPIGCCFLSHDAPDGWHADHLPCGTTG